MLIKSADGSFIGEAGAVDLFQAFYLDFKDVWRKLYTIRLKNAARKIRFLDADFPLGMYYFSLKNYGKRFTDAVVLVKGSPVSFITPYTILSFMHKKGMLPDLKARDIQNNLIQAEENVSVKDIVKLMMEKWIRKVLVKNSVIDDRSLVEHALFSMNNLSLLAKNPDSILDAPVNSFDGLLKEPETYYINDDIYQIAKKVLVSETSCAISEDRRYIITPFDIAIKPFL